MFKKLILILLFFILVYTRFVNLGWGLPYPMHPDERNMANAIQQLNCQVTSYELRVTSLRDCFNPHFYAYGQFPLYLGFILIQIYHWFIRSLGQPISFVEAVMSLRIISTIASIFNVFILLKIVNLILYFTNSEFRVQNSKLSSKSRILNSKSILNYKFLILNLLVLIFSPYFIQFSHFGTTESLLMMFYSLIVYYSLKLISVSSRTRFGIWPNNNKMLKQVQHDNNSILNTLFSGLAIATKISSVIFLIIPITVIANKIFTQPRKPLFKKVGNFFLTTIYYLLTTILISVIFSPHNLISFKEFVGSIRYESDVALGRYVVFYTRQFVNTIPVLFQMTKIFPYTLGWPQYILAILGFFLLPWKNRLINLLRFAFLIYFLTSAFIFAKWTRFTTPIFPILSVFALLFLINVWLKLKRYKHLTYGFNIIFITTILILIVPGISYLSIHTNSDVRFQASNWIYKNIPDSSHILSETANVIDLPVETQNYNYLSFNFYDLDENPALQYQLEKTIQQADYIFVPSRRIYKNHPRGKYPLLNKYYDNLFSGRLGFEQVAEFTSYPSIKLQVMSYELRADFPDEEAEESWTVFDHPVIRIFKKNPDKSEIPNPNNQISSKSQNQNNQFQNNKTTNYQLLATNYLLLVADTPEKWEKGLMFVRSKEEIGGADGMIFIFPKKEPLKFWNKNTLFDLDLYWLDDDTIVGKSFLPSIETSKQIVTVGSPKEVDKVIEIIK